MEFAVDSGLMSVCVFLDLRKAFDIIKHDFLLAKFESCGIKENTFQWFKSYRSGRLQYVVGKNSASELQNLSLGVPQGSWDEHCSISISTT